MGALPPMLPPVAEPLVPRSLAVGQEQMMLLEMPWFHPPALVALWEGENSQCPLIRVGTTAIQMVSSKNRDLFLGESGLQIVPNFNSLTEGFCGPGDNAIKCPWGKCNPSS